MSGFVRAACSKSLMHLGGAGLMWVSVGCASGETDGTKGTDTAEASGELDVDPDPFDGDAPLLVEGRAWRSGDTCFVEGTYDDPQGPADVRRGTVEAIDKRTGDVMWSDDLFVCIDFACIGSFSNAHPEYAAAPCAQLGTTYTLQAYVYDKSGLDSNRLDLTLE